jgi:uncharacterized membrane protein YfcA
MPAKEAVGLMLPLLFITDIFSMFYYFGKWDKKNVIGLLPGALIGILIGTLILKDISDIYLKKTIGVIACIFVFVQLLRERLANASSLRSKLLSLRSINPSLRSRVNSVNRKAKPFLSLRSISEANHKAKPLVNEVNIAVKFKYWHGIPAGMATGLVSTLAHIGGVITSMYLLPQKLSNQAFVGTTTGIYFLINAAKIGPYIYLKLFTRFSLFHDLITVPMIAIGVLVGIFLNKRISSDLFSRIILIVVFVMGLELSGIAGFLWHIFQRVF